LQLILMLPSSSTV